ncbi:MAG: hypothetical protein IKZ82_10160, partial [Clostridia bacterium]|nr:hypothetical protein [Clostridia bacterium]
MKKALSLFLAILTVATLALGFSPAAFAMKDQSVAGIVNTDTFAESGGFAANGDPTGRNISTLSTNNVVNNTITENTATSSQVSTPSDVISAPSVSITLLSTGKPKLTWNAVSGAASYQVKRAMGSGDFNIIATVTGTSYIDSAALTAGQTYSYTVCAVDSNGTVGACSAPVSITIPGGNTTPTPAPTPAGPLPAPVNVSVSMVNGKPVVTWNSVSGAANYQIHRAIKSGSYALAGTVSGTTFTDNDTLTVGKTYYYKVRACDSSGTVGAFSTYVVITIPAASPTPTPAPTPAGPLPAPVNVSVSMVNGKPVVTWSAVSGAANYQ